MQQSLPRQSFPPAPQMPQIRTCLVTSIEEARAAMIDPLATNVFLDTSSGKIYLKSISNDGKPQFLVYAIEEKAIQKDPINEINSRLSNIENFLGGLNESISGNAGVQQSEQVYKPTAAESYESNDEAESTSVSKGYGNDKWQKRK